MKKKFKRLEVMPNDDGTYTIEVWMLPKKKGKCDCPKGECMCNMGGMVSNMKRLTAANSKQLMKKLGDMCGKSESLKEYMGEKED